METTLPISIAVLGNPLVKMVTVSWSATTGMVPQALLFGSEGGRAEATITSPDPQSESIQYHAQITFARSQAAQHSEWSIETNRVIPVNAGGDAIVIDLSSWIHHLIVQFQGDVQNQNCGDIQASTTDHLVVNLVWKGTHLSAPVKCSQRMVPNTSWDILYICPEDHQITANLSAFGALDRQLVKLPAQAINLNQSPLSLRVNHYTLQLMA